MKRRLPKLAPWLAGIYLVCSLFVYFGTLGRNGHEWWPLFLYFIIWPLSLLHTAVSSAVFDWLYPNVAPDWSYALNDYVAGAFYIVGGTIWIWLLAKVISRLATRLFPLRGDENQV